MLPAIWAFPFLLLDLKVIALVANLILAIAWIELLLEVFEVNLTNIAYIIAPNDNLIRVGANIHPKLIGCGSNMIMMMSNSSS
jgi:hypothetical protein